jgi:hypothetical protein
VSEHIRIPLREADLDLTPNDVDDEDGYLTLTDPEADIHVTLPRVLFDRLAEIGDVVTLWDAAEVVGAEEKRCE